MQTHEHRNVDQGRLAVCSGRLYLMPNLNLVAGRAVTCLLSTACTRSLYTQSIAVSVEWPPRYDDCLASCVGLVARKVGVGTIPTFLVKLKELGTDIMPCMEYVIDKTSTFNVHVCNKVCCTLSLTKQALVAHIVAQFVDKQ